MSTSFERYVCDVVIIGRREGKSADRMTARQYRAHRRTMRRLWDKLPKELRKQ